MSDMDRRPDRPQTCAQTRRKIALAVSGDLPEQEAQQVATHLRACRSCSREADRYRECLRDLAALSSEKQPEVVGPEFTDSVMARLTEESSSAPGRHRRVVLRAALLAAACVVLAALGAYMLFGTKAPAQPAGPHVAAQQPVGDSGQTELSVPPGTTLLPRAPLMPAGAPEEETVEF